MADEHLPSESGARKHSRWNYPDDLGTCGQCKFWMSGISDYEEIAECRKHPPVRTARFHLTETNMGADKGRKVSLVGRGEWPVTHYVDCCGEFTKRG